MQRRRFTVGSEQLLLPLGTHMFGLNMAVFEPESPRDTIICMHSYAGNGRDFALLGAALAQRGHRVVAPDLFGRGGSAYPGVAGLLSLESIVAGAAAVFDRFQHDAGSSGRIGLVGMGWGAVIGLLGARMAGVVPASLVICELPLDYDVGADPVVRRAEADLGRRFADEGEGLRHLLTSPEFSMLRPRNAPLLHRLVAAGTGFRLNYDDAIVARTAAFGGRVFDVARLFPEAGARTLLVYGGTPPEAEMERLRGFVSAAPGRTLRWAMMAPGPVTLTRQSEIALMVRYLAGGSGMVRSADRG